MFSVPSRSNRNPTRTLLVAALLSTILSGAGTSPQRNRTHPPDSIRLKKEVYYYGKEGRQPEQVSLSAGPLRMIYEAGNLRYIRLGNKEVVRMIYPSVRDGKWGTMLPEIRNESIEKREHSFLIRFENHYNTGDIRYIFRCTLEGKPDGTVRYEVDGEALSTFQKNRLGICLLHPVPEHAGKPCEVTQPDGTKYTSNFPVYVQGPG
jgi:D-apionolactonase